MQSLFGAAHHIHFITLYLPFLHHMYHMYQCTKYTQALQAIYMSASLCFYKLAVCVQTIPVIQCVLLPQVIWEDIDKVG